MLDFLWGGASSSDDGDEGAASSAAPPLAVAATAVPPAAPRAPAVGRWRAAPGTLQASRYRAKLEEAKSVLHAYSDATNPGWRESVSRELSFQGKHRGREDISALLCDSSTVFVCNARRQTGRRRKAALASYHLGMQKGLCSFMRGAKSCLVGEVSDDAMLWTRPAPDKVQKTMAFKRGLRLRRRPGVKLQKNQRSGQ